MADEVILHLSQPADRDLHDLEGRTFQVHVLPGARLRLYRVEIHRNLGRCPILIGGERCGRAAGHDGKHCWDRGD